VRSNNRRFVGFLDDERRINVALTRAKYCLITIGSSLTLKSNSAWQKYLDWVENNGTYLKYNKGIDVFN
jgi:superfamily I DNA and/or RNA helicase